MSDRHSPRWKTGSWGGHPHYRCNECPYDTLDHGQMVNHARHAHPRLWEGGTEPVDPLAGVPFGSEKARAQAIRAGLTRNDFHGRTPSGKSGFTVADVTSAAKNRQEN